MLNCCTDYQVRIFLNKDVDVFSCHVFPDDGLCVSHIFPDVGLRHTHISWNNTKSIILAFLVLDRLGFCHHLCLSVTWVLAYLSRVSYCNTLCHSYRIGINVKKNLLILQVWTAQQEGHEALESLTWEWAI